MCFGFLKKDCPEALKFQLGVEQGAEFILFYFLYKRTVRDREFAC